MKQDEYNDDVSDKFEKEFTELCVKYKDEIKDGDHIEQICKEVIGSFC